MKNALLQPKKRFALMCRVSTAKQADGASLDVQKQQGRKYIESVNGEVAEVYSFHESGRKDLEDRVIFQKVLIDGGTKKKWDAIWTLDHTRLARNVAGTAEIMSFLQKQKLEWHTPSGMMDINSSSGRAIVQILSVMAQHDTDNSSWRTLESREKMLERGEHAFGRWKWGRRWNKATKTWEVDEAARKLIQRAYRYYVVEGKGLAETAKLLGIAQSSLNKWLRSAGEKESKRTLKTPNGIRTFSLPVPPLLTSRQSEAVENRRKKNSTIRPGTTRKRWLLQGLVRCAECSRTMSGMPSKKGSNKVYNVYRHLMTVDREEGCVFHVPANELESVIVQTCAQVIASSAALVKAIEVALDKGPLDKEEAESELRQLLGESKLAEEKLSLATEELLQPRLTEPIRRAIRIKMKKLSDHVDRIALESKAAQEKIEAMAAPTLQAEDVASRIRALCGFHGVGPRLSMNRAQQRMLVCLVIGRDSHESKNGVFIRMVRPNPAQPRAIYYEWDIRGALAEANGATSTLDSLCRSTELSAIRLADTATAVRLAQLAMEAKPLADLTPPKAKLVFRTKEGKQTYRSFPSSTSGALHPCG